MRQRPARGQFLLPVSLFRGCFRKTGELSPLESLAAKGNKGLPPAESGKVSQDPHHPRTKENEAIKANASEDL